MQHCGVGMITSLIVGTNLHIRSKGSANSTATRCLSLEFSYRRCFSLADDVDFRSGQRIWTFSRSLAVDQHSLVALYQLDLS
jgi:hypothetical protein